METFQINVIIMFGYHFMLLINQIVRFLSNITKENKTHSTVEKSQNLH